MRLLRLLCGASTLLAVIAAAHANDDQESRALLKQAVDYYRVQGDAALAAFSRQGEFIQNDRYVFVIDTAGTMLASGGPSAVLIGRDVSSVLEPELREAFVAALGATEGVQVAEYRWMNWKDGREERKRVYFQRVGQRFIAVGHYLPRATPEQAEGLLARAATAIEADPAASFDAINSLSASFREDDLYVFVIDLRNQRYVAHGYNKRLLGVDFATIHDPEGQPVGEPILQLMKHTETAGFDYRWKNPVTSKVENKHALLRKVGDYLVAVGYYQKN
ncbi:cache domain-containing protein [Pseudomonas stutzeri]|uniref:cache domain-containing protein n=1 Tax=Stutzerimonas stutzeri TaxID=316 RepID=UPI001F52584D|nr:cache domain-containing protein [Stutzerimonas stutzeri]MCI0916285.1 cache domain-containing protein [Stutzerimonas stutzeri]